VDCCLSLPSNKPVITVFGNFTPRIFMSWLLPRSRREFQAQHSSRLVFHRCLAIYDPIRQSWRKDTHHNELASRRMPWIATCSFLLLLGERPTRTRESGMFCLSAFLVLTSHGRPKQHKALSELCPSMQAEDLTSCGCFCYFICTLWRPWQRPTGPPTGVFR
jgi:hypothetical protein